MMYSKKKLRMTVVSGHSPTRTFYSFDLHENLNGSANCCFTEFIIGFLLYVWSSFPTKLLAIWGRYYVVNENNNFMQA
jgi:hypothetical protein